VTCRLEFDVQYLSFPLSQNEGVDMNWTTSVGGEKISIFSINMNWETEYRNSDEPAGNSFVPADWNEKDFLC